MGSGERVSWSLTYSTDCLQFDISCFGVAKAVKAMTAYFTTALVPAAIYLLCSDSSALQMVINPQTKSAQEAALLFHFSITSFFHVHPHVHLHLVWTPGDVTLKPQMAAKLLAATACTRNPPSRLNHIQSAAFQKDQA
jgi:hypothetical protein